MDENGYNLSRQDAAKILKISVRTLDRYIKSSKISFEEVDGRVFLNIDEVRKFSKKSPKKYTNLSTPKKDENVYGQKSDFVYSEKVVLDASIRGNTKKNVYTEKDENVYRQNDEIVYIENDKIDGVSNSPEKIISEENKIFYENPDLEDLKKQLQENIEFQQNKEKALLAQLSEIKFSKSEFEKNIRLEKIKKSFFLILLMALLALQPVWIYFTFFK
jgi:hypothetical protein